MKPSWFKCHSCGALLLRRKSDINNSIRGYGRWMCKSCSLAERNKQRSRPVGSTRETSKGYIMEKTEHGWIQQHRLVVERHTGRKLRDDELVHHIDENKHNNVISNLVIETWGAHTRRHCVGSKRSMVALTNLRISYFKRSTTRMTRSLIEEAKHRRSLGESQRSIAASMNVSPMTISNAVRGKTWKWATEESNCG